MSALDGFEGPLSGVSRVRVDPQEDAVYVRISGELDLGLQESVDTELYKLPERGSPLPVVVDMREVTFADSVGLRVLLKHEVRSRERGFEFALIAPRGQPGKLFEMTGVGQIFKLRPDPEPPSDGSQAADRASAGLGTDEPDPADWLSREKDQG